jgi:hypothetical protein
MAVVRQAEARPSVSGTQSNIDLARPWGRAKSMLFGVVVSGLSGADGLFDAVAEFLVDVLPVLECSLQYWFETLLLSRVGWPEGRSPSGSHRSRHDSLRSPGSCHPAQ